MRQFIPVCTAMAMLSSLAETPARPAHVAWESNYEQGMQKAKAENKPVLIDFGAEWCGWCKKQDEEVFTDAGVAEALAGFVCIKIDVDRALGVAMAYHVRSLPRQVVVNVHRQIVGDQTGFLPVDDFMEFLRGVDGDLRRKTDAATVPDVTAKLEQPARDRSAMSVDLESADSTRLLALLGDPDPAVREQAGVALLNREDAESSLVRGLGDDYLGTRIAALSLLKKMGAPDLAFDPWATTDQRTADLDKWHEWVAQRKSPAGAAEQPSP